MGEPSGDSFSLPIHEDYDSDFEYDQEIGNKRKSRQDLISKSPPQKCSKPKRQTFHDDCAREMGRAQQQMYTALDAYSRHKKLINDYVLCYRGATDKLKRNVINCKSDHDIIRENHRFLWEDEDDARTWGQQLAKKYYDRLFKEYCLCDLSRYKDKKIGMRWRTEKEVILGKGQFFCGSIHCEEKEELDSWEVLFGYVEHSEKKNALVKLRLCEICSNKLHIGYKGKTALKKAKKHNVADKHLSEKNVASEALQSTSDVQKGSEQRSDSSNEAGVWKQPVKEDVEPSKEDVFEEFLEDLFL